MKLVKLSLVAALAASSFSVATAAPLEEVIKDIDVSGALRYRYEGASYAGGRTIAGGYSGANMTSRQEHQFRAQLNFSGAISDNFKAFVQFDYAQNDGGYDSSSVNGNLVYSNNPLTVRQLYLTYTDDASATSVIAGRQQLNTIWTDNGLYGLTGTALKVVNTSIDGLTLAAFAVDSYAEDGDVGDWLGNNIGNLYGAAAVGAYDLGSGQLNPQLWLSYMNDVAFFYALDLAYNTTIFDGVNWNLEAAYLGNAEQTDGNQLGNGNLFGLKGGIEVNGWDASLGGLYYGSKDKFTINTLEDQGNIGVLAGEEIFWSEGSQLNGSTGRNIFGFVTGGYTFDETVRLGADIVFGGTKTETHTGGDKLEAVARVDYKYSPKLDFSAFYSYMNIDKGNSNNTDHNSVRLQALYKF
ncbi:major outer membrane protein [Campylobacter sp. MIT 21-1684]|uniref:major outer membrane protein n=1 Tax=Campylobacter sp. MIT 21-1684 TaxID=2994322 RepID=UPI00224AD998|nr:major outer membrane protein [Campylobacter sp. MIT 21-1684]MCX2682475.1 major outer membrane protein [Campylobacter sp. MIT 21-1684]